MFLKLKILKLNFISLIYLKKSKTNKKYFDNYSQIDRNDSSCARGMYLFDRWITIENRLHRNVICFLFAFHSLSCFYHFNLFTIYFRTDFLLGKDIIFAIVKPPSFFLCIKISAYNLSLIKMVNIGNEE